MADIHLVACAALFVLAAKCGDAVHMQVLQQETDADAQETSRQAISTLVLQLLQHLTGLWQPPALRTLAMQLFSGPGSAQLMPSSESVAPPTPVLASRDARQSKGRAAHTESDAEAAVLDLLRILQAAGVGSWQQLQSMQGSAQGGAGLAALYSACSDEDGVLAFPQDAVTAMQVCCAWGLKCRKPLHPQLTVGARWICAVLPILQ